MRRQNEELATAQRQLLDAQEKARADRKRIADLERQLRDGGQPASAAVQSPQGTGEVTLSLLDMGLNMGVAAEPTPAAADDRLAIVERELANERATADQLRVDLTAAQARVNSES